MKLIDSQIIISKFSHISSIKFTEGSVIKNSKYQRTYYCQLSPTEISQLPQRVYYLYQILITPNQVKLVNQSAYSQSILDHIENQNHLYHISQTIN